MSLNAVTYYEVRCDEEGCRSRPSEDYSAWSDADVAEDEAREADWSTDGQGHHWCAIHWPKCPPGGHLRDDPEERCKRCRQWPEDDEPSGTPPALAEHLAAMAQARGTQAPMQIVHVPAGSSETDGDGDA